MVRRISGIVAGLAAWTIVATAADIAMRTAWPAYAAVERAMAFTLPMMIARLAIGGLATVMLGVVTAAVSRAALAPSIAGVLLLVMFLPEHISIWHQFPVWYHLTFLLSLVPLAFAGGRIGRRPETVNRPMAAG